MPALSLPLPLPLERIQPVTVFLHRHSRLLTTSVILGFVIQRALSNYRAYLALGPGGLSYNVSGWLLALCFQPFSREKLSTEQYDQDGNKDSYFDKGEIKERRGDRPKMGWHVFPSRQLDRHAPVAMRKVGFFTYASLMHLPRLTRTWSPSCLHTSSASTLH